MRAVAWVFLVAFVAYHALSNLAFKLASRGYGMVLLTDHYNMARFATYMRATLNLFTGRASFHVTPKGSDRGGPPLAAVLPQLGVLVANLLASAGCVTRLPAAGDLAAAYAVNAVWAAWHSYVAAWAVAVAYRKRDRRALQRLRAYLPVRVRWDGDREVVGLLRDVHEEAAGLELSGHEPVPSPGGAVRLCLPSGWPHAELVLEGRAVAVRTRGPKVEVGVRLVPPSPGASDTFLSLVLFGAQRRLLERAAGPLDPLGSPLNQRRAGRRQVAPTPVRVTWQDAAVWGLMEDVSAAGARLLVPAGPAEGTEVVVLGRGEETVLSGVVVWKRAMPFGDGEVFWVGLRAGRAVAAEPGHEEPAAARA